MTERVKRQSEIIKEARELVEKMEKLGEGKAVCAVYEDRPEACRAFRAGSFECGKARRANGILGEKFLAQPPAPDRQGRPDTD
jgi:Fe-S-cluster containining protein